jgi:hypothetical protein
MQICPNCNYSNRPGVVFCENCGTTLLGVGVGIATQTLLEKNANIPEAEALNTAVQSVATKEANKPTEDTSPREGLMRLEMGEGTKPILVQIKDIIVFGRRDAATGTIPDVDLTMFAGYRMGVSRRHAEVRINSKDNSLELWDLGSSNGTFQNGDRLIAHRPYPLTDGDQIRFGQLSIKARFQKPKPKNNPTGPLKLPTEGSPTRP